MMRQPIDGYRFRVWRLLPFCLIFMLEAACQGPQIARDMAAEELRLLSQYRQALDNKVAAEQAYYLTAEKQIKENLWELMGDFHKGFVDRRAIVQDALWSKNKTVTEADVMAFIDKTSPHFDKTIEPLHDAIREINDAHLSAVEKVTLQQKRLDHVSTGLKKLATRLSLVDQAKVLFDYVKAVKKAIEDVEGESDDGSDSVAAEPPADS